MTTAPERTPSASRPGTALAAATPVAAVVVAVAVVAAVDWHAGFAASVAVLGSVIVAALAAAVWIEQRRRARAAVELETRSVSLGAIRDLESASSLERARFVADMSHDLRQPLHALGLFLDALERRVTSGEGEKILAKAREAASAMGRAFDALIDLVRLDADAMVPEVERFALDGLFTRLSGDWLDLARSVGADLDLMPSCSEVVGDQRIVGYMLRTLISNAIDLGPRRLVLGARRRGDTVSIELHCAASGDLAAKWNLLQVASGPRAGVNAIHLDLLVARRLADLMAIELRVVAKPGRGLVVSLGLPAAVAASDWPLHGRLVLFMTDDPIRSTAARRALASAGATVYAAGNLRQAAHVARRNRLDLVTTDVALDDGTARDLVGRLASTAPVLANSTPLDRLVAAASALLQ